MYDEEAYWIWVSDALGYGNYKIRAVLRMYPRIKDFYESGSTEWKLCGFLTPREVSLLKNSNLEEAQKIIERAKELDQKVISITHPSYPERLRQIMNPPAVLYIKGELSSFDDQICISIVGTRRATPYGKEVCFQLSYELAKKGVIIVSGGAMGIDCTAHKGAIQAGGKTVSVLGCGINYRYLMGNASLRYEISQNGALISEFPPDCNPLPRYFPIRNRVISGLSSGTVVIEAGERSGSLITANLALQQDRDVFAIPGNVQSSASRGTNLLIQAGAKSVLCAEDILEEYNMMYKPVNLHKIEKDAISKLLDVSKSEAEICANLSEQAALVLSALKTEPPKHIDSICQQTNLTAGETLKAITELEIRTLVQALPGKRYTKIK